MNTERIQRMTELLQRCLNVIELNIDDDSAKHAGHAGAKDGRGHFNLQICATEFSGLSTLQRHRLIYTALGDMMQTDIHALSIKASEPH